MLRSIMPPPPRHPSPMTASRPRNQTSLNSSMFSRDFAEWRERLQNVSNALKSPARNHVEKRRCAMSPTQKSPPPLF